MLDFGYYNMDCMQGMKEFPDKYFDLAIVDPPYGDGGVPKEQTHHERTQKRPTSAELVERGRRSSEKNHSVGRRAGKRVFRRAFPRLTKSDYMGG